ncbi:BatD family protein [Thiorhodococcus minor]|uniref:Protein BatD n=1 Tax=Thiorhodococcus minor TaxID=57489 RepID=A0A6M0JYP3_9GAMM|nr:BatD family protein [Thiorhodococcus minor]NEV62582.1 hypothetical protein [Thiorhodococcus minor]
MLALLLAGASIKPLMAQPYRYGPGGYGQPYYAPPYYGQQAQPQQVQPRQPGQTQDPRFRPLPPSNAQGTPPGYPARPAQPLSAPQGRGQMPYGYPGYQQPSWQQGYGQQSFPATRGQPPKIEWRLEELDPYLQQPVVLHLNVVSSDNLSTADLELPPSSDFLFKTLKGPDTGTRQRDGRREIVNSFLLSVVPLRAGDLKLPQIKVTGEQVVGGLTQRYEARPGRTIQVQVRPSMTSVRPWLPLRSLSLKSSLDREGALAPGQPVTLAIEIRGEGATAVQLPTMENQLEGTDFRVYREQTLTDTQLSSDERRLSATRTEYYTLVPQVGGRITLPEMSIAWWNIDLGVREVTRLPLKTLSVRGGGPFGFSASALTMSGWAKIWIPLAGLGLLVVGYWVGVLFRGRPWQLGRASLGAMWRMLRAGIGLLARKAAPYLAGLRPTLLLSKARAAFWRMLPASTQMSRCIRRANRASTPLEWHALFEQQARACASNQGDLTRPALSQQILAHRPAADPQKLEHLMRQLDSARYGQQSIDFKRWKRELMAQLRPGAGLLRRTRGEDGRLRWAALPALNPGS